MQISIQITAAGADEIALAARAIQVLGGDPAQLALPLSLSPGLAVTVSDLQKLIEDVPLSGGQQTLGSEDAPTSGVIEPPEYDAAGRRWDARIHSSSKALTVDGKWRQRRNLDPAVLKAVEAETISVVVPPPPAAPVPFAERWRSGLAATGSEPITFAAFLPKVTAAMGSGAFTMATVVEACQSVGAANLPALANTPDLIPLVAAALGIAL